jgi:hypothetical protein
MCPPLFSRLLCRGRARLRPSSDRSLLERVGVTGSLTRTRSRVHARLLPTRRGVTRVPACAREVAQMVVGGGSFHASTSRSRSWRSKRSFRSSPPRRFWVTGSGTRTLLMTPSASHSRSDHGDTPRYAAAETRSRSLATRGEPDSGAGVSGRRPVFVGDPGSSVAATCIASGFRGRPGFPRRRTLAAASTSGLPAACLSLLGRCWLSMPGRSRQTMCHGCPPDAIATESAGFSPVSLDSSVDTSQHFRGRCAFLRFPPPALRFRSPCPPCSTAAPIGGRHAGEQARTARRAHRPRAGAASARPSRESTSAPPPSRSRTA